MMNVDQTLFDESVTLRKLLLSNKRYGFENGEEDETSGGSGSYSQMVHEVERVTESLVQTQTWLDQTEEENRILREAVDELRREDETLRNEIERLNNEILDRDECRARPELERRLRKAVEFLKKDLDKLTERYKEAEEQIERYQKTIADLKVAKATTEVVAEERETRALSSGQELKICKEQLREATSGNAILLEEVASLREELARTKQIADQKDILIRKEVEGKVKDKITYEVREVVTQQITEKVSREVTAKVKAQTDTEIKTLREQLKKIIKENADLQTKIEVAEQLASESGSLQHEIEALTFELERYETIICEAREDHELHLTKLETDYRIQMQAMREEASKEKWAHASEIRKQMMAEREREADNFAQRVESLSKQTDRLLEKAEKEKEQYANSVKRKVQKEMGQEIRSLSEKLEAQQRETEQLRQTMKEEKARGISDQSSRIETLSKENNVLRGQVATLEEELEQVWQESERLEKELKIATEEKITLNRKIHNLSTLNNRYKHDKEESSKEFEEMRVVFREACAKAEDHIRKLNARSRPKAKDASREAIKALEDTKRSLLLRVKLYEEENSLLKSQNEELRKPSDRRAPLAAPPNRQNSDDIQRAHQVELAKVGENFEKSRRLYSDTQTRNEQEISELKTQVEGLTRANREYSDQFKAFQEKLDHLEQDLDTSRLEMERTEAVLQKTREEKHILLRQMEEGQRKSRTALGKSEDERLKLQKSLEDIKRSILGSGASSQDLGNGADPSHVENRDTAQEEQENSRDERDDDRDQGTTDTTGIFSRLNDLLERKEKKYLRNDVLIQDAGVPNETPFIHDSSSKTTTLLPRDEIILDGVAGRAGSQSRRVEPISLPEDRPKTRFSFYPQPDETTEEVSGGKGKKSVRWNLVGEQMDSSTGDISGEGRDESRNPSIDNLKEEPALTDGGNREDEASTTLTVQSSPITFVTTEDQGAPATNESDDHVSTSSRSSPDGELHPEDKSLEGMLRTPDSVGEETREQSETTSDGDVHDQTPDDSQGKGGDDEGNEDTQASQKSTNHREASPLVPSETTEPPPMVEHSPKQIVPLSYIGRLRKNSEHPRSFRKAKRTRWVRSDSSKDGKDVTVILESQGWDHQAIQGGEKGVLLRTVEEEEEEPSRHSPEGTPALATVQTSE